MAISKKAKMTFGAIIDAASEYRLCLVQSADRKTGKTVYVLCETFQENGVVHTNPLGKLFSGNPFNEVTPPGVVAPKLI